MTKTKAKSKSPKTSVTPLGDRILVRRMDAEETSKGGIILPDSAKEKPAEGTVISVGAGRITDTGERMEMSLKAKDRILFSAYSGSEIKLDGQDYLIMSEDEVLAVID
jgi:chaperonin GroES